MHIRKKIFAYSSLCLLVTACSASGPRYVPRPHVPPTQYTAADHAQDERDTKLYRQYEQREPCQYYRDLPRNALDRCQPKPEPVQPAPAIIATYEVYFDLDKADIRSDAERTLKRVAGEIHTFEPAKVTVTGYTDTSGASDYNQALSRRRTEAVVAALQDRGIKSEVLSEKARGETHLAVQTGDGVVLQENRRAVIDFRR